MGDEVDWADVGGRSIQIGLRNIRNADAVRAILAFAAIVRNRGVVTEQFWRERELPVGEPGDRILITWLQLAGIGHKKAIVDKLVCLAHTGDIDAFAFKLFQPFRGKTLVHA